MDLALDPAMTVALLAKSGEHVIVENIWVDAMREIASRAKLVTTALETGTLQGPAL